MALIERLALCARWPAKSSVESWFSGSRPFSFRYSAHFVSCGQYLLGEVGVAFHAAPGRPAGSACCRSLPPASGSLRCARRRRRPGRWPADTCPDRAARTATASARMRGVLQHRLAAALEQPRVEQQGERRAGIDHVHGGDAAVAEVLLGEDTWRCRRRRPPVCARPASGGRPGQPAGRTSRRPPGAGRPSVPRRKPCSWPAAHRDRGGRLRSRSAASAPLRRHQARSRRSKYSME